MEIRRLKFEEIAPYLPYKVQIQHIKSKEIVIADGIMKQYEDRTFMYYWEKNYGTINASSNYNLILRPLSDLKNEVVHEGKTYNFWSEMFIPKFEREQLETWITDNKAYLGSSISYLVILEMIKHHFDVFNLIENGLAISYHELQSA